MSREVSQSGTILEALPNGKFIVEVGGENHQCYLSGKMVLNQIRCLVGDKVKVELPKGSAIGRIVYRGW